MEEEEENEVKNVKGELTEKEENEVTSVDWSRYKIFFHYMGGWIPILIGWGIMFS